MAVRSYNYDEAKSTMAKIQEEAGKVEKYLQNCDDIIKQNVGVENGWSGRRANDFKQKWEKSAAEFNSFVQLINAYAGRIEESTRAHESFDNKTI